MNKDEILITIILENKYKPITIYTKDNILINGLFESYNKNDNLIKLIKYCSLNKNYNLSGFLKLDNIKYFKFNNKLDKRNIDLIENRKQNKVFSNNFEKDSDINKEKKKNKVKKDFIIYNNFENKEELLEDNENDNDFDQFKFNNDNFNIKDDYKESTYTSEINKNDYTETEMKNINKLCNEIKNNDIENLKNNRHYLEEKNKLKLGNKNENEEKLYSKVEKLSLKDKIKMKNEKMNKKQDNDDIIKNNRINIMKLKRMTGKTEEFIKDKN